MNCSIKSFKSIENLIVNSDFKNVYFIYFFFILFRFIYFIQILKTFCSNNQRCILYLPLIQAFSYENFRYSFEPVTNCPEKLLFLANLKYSLPQGVFFFLFLLFVSSFEQSGGRVGLHLIFLHYVCMFLVYVSCIRTPEIFFQTIKY